MAHHSRSKLIITALVFYCSCSGELPDPNSCKSDDDCNADGETMGMVCSEAGSCIVMVDTRPPPPPAAFYVQIKDDTDGTPLAGVKICVFAEGTTVEETLYETVSASTGTASIAVDRRLDPSDSEVTLPSDKKYVFWTSYVPLNETDTIRYLPSETVFAYSSPQGIVLKEDVNIPMKRCGAGTDSECKGAGKCFQR